MVIGVTAKTMTFFDTLLPIAFPRIVHGVTALLGLLIGQKEGGLDLVLLQYLSNILSHGHIAGIKG
jgi:hypothetical protein